MLEIGLVLFVVLMLAWAGIADAFVAAHPDDERGRYGAPPREVLTWWWNRIRRT